MKSLFRFLVVVVLLLGSAAFAVRDSVYWTPLEIQRGLDEKNVERVERVVAFERFAASAGTAIGGVVADEMGLGGRDAGSKMLSALVGAFAGAAGDAVAKDAAKEMRAAIRDGRYERRFGPLVVNPGLEALGEYTNTGEGALLAIKGTCEGKPASITLELERYDDGLIAGHPRRFVVVGVEPESAKRLAKLCK